jgi:hypothetical protein
MKKLHFIILLFALNITAQEVYTSRGGRVYQNGMKLSIDTISARFEKNPEILNSYLAGKTKQTFGNILLWGGLGVGVGKFIYAAIGPSNDEIILVSPGNNVIGAIYETKSNYTNTLFFVSAAMILVAIPIKIGFREKIKKSVALMNEVAKNPKTTFNIESTQIIANRNGIGFAITF